MVTWTNQMKKSYLVINAYSFSHTSFLGSQFTVPKLYSAFAQHMRKNEKKNIKFTLRYIYESSIRIFTFFYKFEYSKNINILTRTMKGWMFFFLGKITKKNLIFFIQRDKNIVILKTFLCVSIERYFLLIVIIIIT